MNKHTWTAMAVGATCALLVAGCRDSRAGSRNNTQDNQGARAGDDKTLSLVIAYGSEKKTWLGDETARFVATHPKTASGRPIVVDARPMGSGQAATEIASGRLKPAVFAPASSLYVAELDRQLAGRGAAGALAGGPKGEGAVVSAEPLAISPVIVAMWRPMAEALGWPDKRIGWADLLRVSTEPEGWGRYGHPDWGRFKLGHTSPELSSSGLCAVLAEVYAGAGKTRGLEAADLDAPSTRAFVRTVEGTVVHYGKSTGFFVDKMLSRGPGSLSALVAYENLVIESYATHPAVPLVAVYPKEGTFWADHPFAVLRSASPDERDAAAQLLAHLKSRAAQERALANGFRPADPKVAIGAPVDAAHGADAKQPETLLPIPPADVTARLVPLWKETKRGADVALVFDKSGSMQGAPLTQAQAGARAFVRALADEDSVSYVPFDETVHPSRGPWRVGTDRAAIDGQVAMTSAFGGTALYDAIARTWDEASERAKRSPATIHAVVVMTDGRDESSAMTLPALRLKLAAARTSDGEVPVRVFTIAYGDGADDRVLGEIAESARGWSGRGTPENIQQVYADVAAFF
jgi:Ca-activated chloride channel homolog